MQTPPRPTSKLFLILALWVAGLGAAMQFAKFSVTFPHIKQAYASAGSEVGLLVSIIGFLGIALGLFAGLIVARIGYRRLLLSALLLGAAMSLYQATLPSFALMLASRALEGASHLVIVVAAPTLIAQLSAPRFRGLAMTLWSTFFGVAFALVAWLGIPLVDNHGLPSLFIAHALFMLTIAAILALTLPTLITSKDQALPLNAREIAQAHIRTYRSPQTAAPALGWLCYTLTFVSLLTVLPDLVPSTDRAFVARAMPVASITVSMICGAFILPRLSAINTVQLGFALAIGVLIFFWFSDQKTWACIALMGVLGLVQAASFAAIPQLNDKAEAQARANGAMAQMGNLGNTLGTPLLLTLLAAFGLQGMIWGIGACYGTGIVLHQIMRYRRANQQSSAQ